MTTIEKIFQLISKENISAFALSNKLGLNKNALSDWKCGKANPSADALSKIADYFNVSVDYLLGRTENQVPNTSVPVFSEKARMIARKYEKLNEKQKAFIQSAIDTWDDED